MIFSVFNYLEVQKEIEVLDAIDTIDLKQVKEAGIFLDGCGVSFLKIIYLSPNSSY